MPTATKNSSYRENTSERHCQTMRLGMVGFGRMGGEIVKCLEQQDSIRLVAVATKSCAANNNCTTRSELNSRYGNSLVITDSISDVFCIADIVVDFSSNEALQQCLICADRAKKPLVSGTTGLSKETAETLGLVAKRIPILWTPNSAPGINTILQILKRHAELSANYDIEILDMHHRRKKDSPSGTAMLLAESIKNCNPEQNINFSSMRCGDVPGRHSIIFANNEEIITISHEPVSRAVFATNAIKAAQWLFRQRKPGLYSMSDVLAL